MRRLDKALLKFTNKAIVQMLWETAWPVQIPARADRATQAISKHDPWPLTSSSTDPHPEHSRTFIATSQFYPPEYH